jgi:hypothetical protein
MGMNVAAQRLDFGGAPDDGVDDVHEGFLALSEPETKLYASPDAKAKFHAPLQTRARYVPLHRATHLFMTYREPPDENPCCTTPASGIA